MKIKENKGSQVGHTKKKNIQKNIKTFLKKKKKKKKKERPAHLRVCVTKK
jgi:Holliday junction resolvasome RuvABC endonuclease subunit